MQLSEHFTLEEFEHSDTAAARGLDNHAPAEVLQTLMDFCALVLEPIRAHFDRPLVITSGYRSPEVNAAVGGSKLSYHMARPGCCAADIIVRGVPLAKVFGWIATQREFDYDQVIIERSKGHAGAKALPPLDGGDDGACCHVQYRAVSPRRIAMSGSTHGQGVYQRIAA